MLAAGLGVLLATTAPAHTAAAGTPSGHEPKEPHRVAADLLYPWGYHDLPGDGHSMGTVGWQGHAVSGPWGSFASISGSARKFEATAT